MFQFQRRRAGPVCPALQVPCHCPANDILSTLLRLPVWRYLSLLTADEDKVPRGTPCMQQNTTTANCQTPAHLREAPTSRFGPILPHLIPGGRADFVVTLLRIVRGSMTLLYISARGTLRVSYVLEVPGRVCSCPSCTSYLPPTILSAPILEPGHVLSVSNRRHSLASLLP